MSRQLVTWFMERSLLDRRAVAPVRAVPPGMAIGAAAGCGPSRSSWQAEAVGPSVLGVCFHQSALDLRQGRPHSGLEWSPSRPRPTSLSAQWRRRRTRPRGHSPGAGRRATGSGAGCQRRGAAPRADRPTPARRFRPPGRRRAPSTSGLLGTGTPQAASAASARAAAGARPRPGGRPRDGESGRAHRRPSGPGRRRGRRRGPRCRAPRAPPRADPAPRRSVCACARSRAGSLRVRGRGARRPRQFALMAGRCRRGRGLVGDLLPAPVAGSPGPRSPRSASLDRPTLGCDQGQ
jgi:hypothetical protein